MVIKACLKSILGHCVMSERNACAQNVTLSTFFSQYPREPNTIIQSKKPYQRRGLHEPKINKNTQKCGGGGKHYLLVAGAALAILAPFQGAQAVIIDFQSLEQNNSVVNYAGFTYTEDGFTLDSLSTSEPFAFFGTQESRYPGSTALFNNEIDGITRLTQNGGGLFDLNSIQLTSLNGDDSVTVNFTGTKADSSTVTQAFTTDAILSTLETFTFNSSFTNLVSVEWIQAFPFHQFDNINVTPVPEPSAILGLLGLGLLGIGSQFK
jgi:hypothetical protein